MTDKQKRKKLSVRTIGCRLNQYETERMVADIVPYGFERVKDSEPADLYLINTCTVTHRADSDARYYIRRAARQNPEGRIVVAGCFVDKDPEKVAGMEPVDVIIKNVEKDAVAQILPTQLPDLFRDEPDKGCSTSISEFHAHNRAWIKISDGCNQWCSFCILPRVRGRLRNRPPLEIIEEVQKLAAHGYEEVVLTGINLGHYKNRKSEPQVKNLAALIRMMLDQTEIKRIRVSSIEPQTVRGDLLSLYQEGSPRLCRHWHIPLQAGSSRVLKMMRRPYDQNTYIERVTNIKEAVPNTIVGADVIVGFPGEADDDFNRTRRLAESGLIDYLHVFSYSDRPETFATDNYDEKINPEVIKERNGILTRISNDLRMKAYQRQVGEILPVISEHRKSVDGELYGIADNYVRVKLPNDFISTKSITNVKIESASLDYVEGHVLS